MQKTKPRSKLPKDKLNTNLLGKMSNAAMPSRSQMPTLHLTGAHAKHFHGMKPGSKVSAHIRGTLQNVGMDQYANNDPTATIQLTHINPRAKKGGMPPPGVPSGGMPIGGM